MRAVQKMALSLLISVVAFSLFALFAYSGFFSFIQSNFYDLRVRQQIMRGLNGVRSAVTTYEKRYFDRFAPILTANAIRRINNVNQSAQDIFERKNLFEKLQTEYPGIGSVRFIDRQGNIHFSTLQSDVLRATNYETVYKTLAMADPHDPFAREEESTAKAQAVYIDGTGQRLLFRLPWTGYLGDIVGSAVFSLTIDDLQSYLVRVGVLGPGRPFSSVGNAGFLIGIDLANNEKLQQEILQDWKSNRATGETGLPVAANTGGGQLFLFSVKTASLGFVGEVVPQSAFALDKTLQLLLSVSLFLTVFLLAFLILSLRQDKLLVLADRIKRFQINFLKEYLESKSTLDWARWHSELEYRRNEVRREIKKGIGRLGKEREATVDGLIDKSWDEILTVIGKRVEDDSVSAREVRGLEEAIRKLLASGELAGAVSRGIPAPVRKTSDGRAHPEKAETPGTENLEEVEAVEEPEELAEAEETPAGEEAEALEEVEAVEEPEELAEAEEAPAGEEAEALEEIEAVEEPEELAEVEEAPAGEEAEALEEVEELEELTEVEEAPSAEGAEAPEEAEAVEELEELPEAVGVGVGRGATEAATGPAGISSAEVQAPDLENLGDFENDEVLDLEAIFHGDELLADIDVFEEMETEARKLDTRDRPREEPPREPLSPGQPEAGGTKNEAARSQPTTGGRETQEEIEELSSELEQVEPLEVTHPEIARVDEGEVEEEFEQIEMLEPAEVDVQTDLSRSDMTSEEASLQTASYGFSLFKEFQGKRTPLFAEPSKPDTFGELMEIDESESEMNENDHDVRAVPVGEEQEETARESKPGEPESAAVGNGASAEAHERQETEEVEPVEELESLEPVEDQGTGAKAEVGEVQPDGELQEVESAEEVESLEELGKGEETQTEGPVEMPAVSAPRTWSARGAVGGDDAGKPRGLTSAELEFERRIRELVARKQIEVYSLSDVKSMGLVPDEAIEVSDGVYKIKEEIVGRTGSGKDSELRDLVDSVVSSGTEEGETSAIGQLLSIPTVELSFDDVEGASRGGNTDEREAAARSPRSPDRKHGIRIMLTENGFDYDSFRSEFKSNYMGIMKSLMRISQKVDAIYAAILVPKEGGLVTEYSIGLDDSSTYSLKFDRSDPVLRYLFAQRDLVYLRLTKTGVGEFDTKVAPRDLRFMTGTIYLPIVFAGHQGYLFFGLKNSELSIHDYMLQILEE